MSPKRSVLFGLVLALLVFLLAPALQGGLLALTKGPSLPPASAEEVARAERETERLAAALRARLPRRAYLIVSSTDNRFHLMQGGEPLREGLCSTGSYVRLEGTDGRSWTFQTPRGAFRIQHKRENPVWTKPDWAFVEAGLPVPPPGSPERLERGVLGDYALALGDGYLIHGTLYQRLLGRPVTHGCVRLGDADLEAVYRTLPVGATVMIY